MGMGYNSGRTQAVLTQNIDDTTPIPVYNSIPEGATPVQVNFLTGTSITAAYSTKYTPTVGKVFYLLGVSVANMTAITFGDNGTDKISMAGNVTYAPINSLVNTPVSFSTTVQIKGSATATIYGGFWGYEVDA